MQSNDNIISYTESISSFYLKNQCNLKITRLNISNVRHKFHPISDMLNTLLIDLMFIQETKLDRSFPSGQFHVDKYFTYREDLSCNSGGIAAIVRSDLPQRDHPCLNRQVSTYRWSDNVFTG